MLLLHLSQDVSDLPLSHLQQEWERGKGRPLRRETQDTRNKQNWHSGLGIQVRGGLRVRVILGSCLQRIRASIVKYSK
jgi:hypothetical protein